MNLHFIAEWLDSACHGFDGAILGFMHTLAEAAGFILTPLAEIFAFIGDNGYMCFLLALILLCFPKTRKAGVCIIFAVGFGALITNLTLKEAICRARPYMSGDIDFAAWWNYIGAPIESEFSFPSGHTTAAMAGAVAVCLNFRKLRFIIPALCYAVIMGLSRNYLMVHYPTDVIAGLVVGTIGALLSYLFVYLVYRFIIEKYSDKKLFAFALNFDVRNIFKRKTKEQ